MNIFGKLATTFDPAYRQKTNEADAIRAAHATQGGILTNSWYRLSNLSNNIVGLSFVCNCAREVQLLNLFEWLRDYECPQCHTKFNLLKALGLAPEASSAELAAKVAMLPIRPRAAGQPPQPRVLDTWSGSDETASYENFDPGKGGLF